MDDIKLEINQRGDGAFYLLHDGKVIAKMLLGIDSNHLNAYHTESMIEGKGYAKKLFDAMVTYAREHRLKVTPYCPYVHAQLKRHPEQYADIWNREKKI